MLALILAHFAVGAFAPLFARRWGRDTFLVLAALPLVAFGYALAQTRATADGEVVTSVVSWVPELGLDLAFAMGSLQWVLALIVAGVGVVVLAYCRWYFAADEPGLGSFAGCFVAFSGAMLGLVLADNLVLLYVFWELTTVFSYLLIGHDPAKRASRAAGMQALIVTTFGGLAMLVGVLLIGLEAGTFRITEILADVPTGTPVTVAVLLLVVGALSKSALFPFHFWLPGAMAAPTPVSAYLHAAAMVKAGVYLVALLAPAFAGVPGWRAVLLGLGAWTLLLGGWRALRQHDIKLLLAYGTVSQLGLLMLVLSVGTQEAALAGVALLIAHALFKATLFLVVGVVDRATGTRDMRELSGVGRSMPVLRLAAFAAGASMAGIPPLAGFVAKETVYDALFAVADTGDGTGVGPVYGWAVLVAVVLGSALTVAYTARFLWGAFAAKPGRPDTVVRAPAAGMVAGPVLLAALSLAVGFAGAAETTALLPYVDQFTAGDHAELKLWHGFGPALALSALSWVIGLALFARRAPVSAIQSALAGGLSTERGYARTMRLIDRTAVELTGRTQRGSLAIYLSVILSVVVVVPGSVLLLRTGWPDNLVLWDNPVQPAVGVIAAIAAVLTARSRRRLRAVIMVGVTGYCTATLFLLQSAPDLALTQVLVETVTLVAFVLVLRRLPQYFTDRPLTRGRYWRMAIGALVAVAVAGFMITATGARSYAPDSTGFGPAAVEHGGKDIVNITLVDIRAWDTMGEISVLVAAATGVASLIFIRTRRSGIRRVEDIEQTPARAAEPEPGGGPEWLAGGRTLAPERRSIIFEVMTRLVFHPIVVLSLFLLFSGHNNPGGGLAAGLVAGLALTVRYLAGGRYELDEAAPIDAGVLMGAGLVVATGAGLASLLAGGSVLESAIYDLPVPLVGELHIVTSIFFDIGVYLVVVGLMLDLLRSLGSGIDRHIVAEEGDRPVPEEALV